MPKNNIKAAGAAYMAFMLMGSLISIITASFNTLSRHYGVGLTQIGFMISAMALGRLSTIFFSGIVSDRFGRKPVLALAAILIGICYFFVPMNKSYYAGLWLFVIAGMGHGMADSSASALIFDCFPQNSRVPVALIQAFFCLGAMASPVISSILLEADMFFGLMFWAFGVAALVSFFAFVFLKLPAPPAKEETNIQDNERSPDGQNNKKINLVIIAAISVAYSTATTLLTTWSGTLAMERQRATEAESLGILTYFNLGCITGTVIMSRLLKKLHPASLLALNCTALTFTIGIYSFTSFPISVIFLLAGFFAGINFSLLLSIAGELFPTKRASVSGVVMGMAAVGSVITPMFSGFLYENYGITDAFNSIFAVLVLLILLCTILFVRHLKNSSF